MVHLQVLDIPFTFLKLTGLWQDSACSWRYRAFGLILISIFTLAGGVTSSVHLIYVYENGTLREFSNALSIFCYVISFCLKTVWFCKNVERVKELQSTLESILEKQMSVMHADSRKRHDKQLKRVVRVIFASLFATLIVSCIMTLANIQHKTLIVESYFPWDYKKNLLSYWLTFAYQFAAFAFITITGCSFDVIPIIFMSFTSLIANELSTEISSVDNETKLQECIERHINIKSFASKVSNKLSFAFFNQAVMSSVVLCTLIFYLSTVGINNISVRSHSMLIIHFQLSPIADSLDFVKMSSFIVYTFLEIFLPCYYGNEISLAFAELSTSLFHSNWIESSKKHRTAMKIFLENSKKPIKITSVGLLDVDFKTFASICNAAYSLYAVFEKVNCR